MRSQWEVGIVWSELVLTKLHGHEGCHPRMEPRKGRLRGCMIQLAPPSLALERSSKAVCLRDSGMYSNSSASLFRRVSVLKSCLQLYGCAGCRMLWAALRVACSSSLALLAARLCIRCPVLYDSPFSTPISTQISSVIHREVMSKQYLCQ